MEYEMFMEKYRYSHGDRLCSEQQWNIGGTVGSCWGMRQLDIQEAPDTFEELNDFLNDIDSEMDEDVKEEIFHKCVTIQSSDECDWYGGKRYYSYYEVNLIDLYYELDERNLLKEEENEEEE